MSNATAPDPPVRHEPTDWQHYRLWQRVREALYALPGYFRSSTVIEGMLATDIFTLNQPLAATIEEQVVYTLNGMRSVWDPAKEYQSYHFVRQPQTFPDVLLRRQTNGRHILMGIELKGWYLLANEGMPNFRFTISSKACNDWDLIAVIPWVLDNVISGSPIVYPPFVELARYAAEQRNHYWRYERTTTGDATIIEAGNVHPYPSKGDRITDQARNDRGGNFGRLARYGMMNEYVQQLRKTEIRGVACEAWLRFFRSHARSSEDAS